MVHSCKDQILSTPGCLDAGDGANLEIRGLVARAGWKHSGAEIIWQAIRTAVVGSFSHSVWTAARLLVLFQSHIHCI